MNLKELKLKKVKKGTVAYYVLSALTAFAVFVVVTMRKAIFTPDSIFYKLYDAELADDVIVRLIKIGVVVVIVYGLCAVAKILTIIGAKSTDNKRKTWLYLFGSMIKYLSIIVGLLTLLGVVGVDTTALVTGAGVLTLIVGLGCQSLVSDIVAGMFIMLEGNFEIGDIIVVDGFRGTVQQIGLRTTSIIDGVGNVKTINNSHLVDVINNSRNLSVAACVIGIEYDESLERVEKIVTDALPAIKENIPTIVDGPFYQGVYELGASSVNIKVVAKCKESNKYSTELALNREMKLLFDKNNVNIPYNQMVISYRDE